MAQVLDVLLSWQGMLVVGMSLAMLYLGRDELW